MTAMQSASEYCVCAVRGANPMWLMISLTHDAPKVLAPVDHTCSQIPQLDRQRNPGQLLRQGVPMGRPEIRLARGSRGQLCCNLRSISNK
jgi:hypothetical protein